MTETKDTKKKATKPRPKSGSRSAKAASGKAVVKKSAPKKKAPAKKVAKTSDKYAVIATGGKQYRVAVGDKLKIEKVLGKVKGNSREEYKEGDKLTFDNVLLIDNGKDDITLGTPFIKGSSIGATIIKIDRAKKVNVVRYKAKSRYFKQYGHRQPYFEITIDSIK